MKGVVLMEFLLNFPKNIVFGEDTVKKLGDYVMGYGKSCIMVTGSTSLVKSGTMGIMEGSLLDKGITCKAIYNVKGEPDCTMVDEVRELAKSKAADFIIGAGGGSPLDIAKAAAGLHGQELPTSDYLNKEPYEYKGIPFIAIPTTAGTGSEITNNSVLHNPVTGNKVSLAHPDFQSKVAIVDPTLTYNMPASITAYTGMDALTHAIESYTSIAANPITSTLAEKAIELIMSSLERAVKNGKDVAARRDMAMGSMVAALAFAQTGVGVAHAISHPLGAIFDIPHGILNSILLPEAIDFNNESCPLKYKRIEELIGINEKLSNYIRKMIQGMPIPQNLTEAGYKKGREDEILEMTFQSRSLYKNPRKVEEKDVVGILARCI